MALAGSVCICACKLCRQATSVCACVCLLTQHLCAGLWLQAVRGSTGNAVLGLKTLKYSTAEQKITCVTMVVHGCCLSVHVFVLAVSHLSVCVCRPMQGGSRTTCLCTTVHMSV